MEPLQSCALNPSRRLVSVAGMVVKGGADGNQRHGQDFPKFVNENLLARAAKPDKHDTRAGSPNPGNQGGLFFLVQRSEPGWLGPSDGQAGEALQEPLCER